MKLAIFDFDGTLFQGSAVPYLTKAYKEKGYPKAPYNNYMMQVVKGLVKYKNPFIKKYDKEHFRRDAAKEFVKTFNHQEESYLKGFMEESAKAMVGMMSQTVVEELKRCKEEGYHTIVLSGCYTLLLEEIAQHYGIDTVIGTDIEARHIIEGKVVIDTLDVAMGKRKVEKLQAAFESQAVNWEESVAYGDSVYDAEILSLTGKPVAVRPDEGLLKIAKERSWRIIES